jgi:hypothetical protein
VAACDVITVCNGCSGAAVEGARGLEKVTVGDGIVEKTVSVLGSFNGDVVRKVEFEEVFGGLAVVISYSSLASKTLIVDVCCREGGKR